MTEKSTGKLFAEHCTYQEGNLDVVKKTTTKDDGRALYYYHFPATASEEEAKVFEAIDAEVEIVERCEETTNV